MMLFKNLPGHTKGYQTFQSEVKLNYSWNRCIPTATMFLLLTSYILCLFTCTSRVLFICRKSSIFACSSTISFSRCSCTAFSSWIFFCALSLFSLFSWWSSNFLSLIQRNFLGHTATSGCEGFPAFRELTLSPSSGCAGGLVATKLMTRWPKRMARCPPSRQCWCYQTTSTAWRWWWS